MNGGMIAHNCRYIFFSDWGSPPHIARVNMDGSDYAVPVISSLVWPNGVAVDRENLRIYWIDAWIEKLESSTYDGRDRRLLLDARFLPGFHPYGITFFNGFVFWSNYYNSSVHQGTIRDGNLVRQTIIHDKVRSPAQFQVVSDSHPRPGGKYT